MNENERLSHCYLGDGVYAEKQENFIIIRTSSHKDEECHNKIYFNKDVLVNLLVWLKSLNMTDTVSLH